MKTLITLFFSFFSFALMLAQGSYAPNAITLGTTAIYKDSSIFINWATSCQVNRGWQNITDTTLERASSGVSTNALGKSGLNGTVSLGDNGEAILTFEHPIINGAGFDFAVFENAFNHTFLELAFVEVSSNGIDFVRFPSDSETQTSTQTGSFEDLDPTNIHNLAGKYIVGYGTPFDLEDLVDSTLIDVNNINYIKIIDVIGIINSSFSTLDNNYNQINDPFPTPYPTSGFDLDAVGIIHQFVGIEKNKLRTLKLYPNPSNGQFTIEYQNNELKNILVFDQLGNLLLTKKVTSETVNFNTNLIPGLYIIKTVFKRSTTFNKVIIQ